MGVHAYAFKSVQNLRGYIPSSSQFQLKFGNFTMSSLRIATRVNWGLIFKRHQLKAILNILPRRVQFDKSSIKIRELKVIQNPESMKRRLLIRLVTAASGHSASNKGSFDNLVPTAKSPSQTDIFKKHQKSPCFECAADEESEASSMFFKWKKKSIMSLQKAYFVPKLAIHLCLDFRCPHWWEKIKSEMWKFFFYEKCHVGGHAIWENGCSEEKAFLCLESIAEIWCLWSSFYLKCVSWERERERESKKPILLLQESYRKQSMWKCKRQTGGIIGV